MPGGGVAEILRGGAEGDGKSDTGVVHDALRRLVKAKEMESEARAAAHLLGQEESGPPKESVQGLSGLVSAAREMAGLDTDRRTAALEESEYWRRRAIEAEERGKANRGEERQQNMDAMAAMGQMMMGMSTMVVGLVEKMANGVQKPEPDPLQQRIMDIGLMALSSRPDPDEELEKHIKVAERLGYRRPADSDPSVINLDAVRAKHQMTLEERRIALEERRLDREMARLDKVALGEVQAKTKQADALAQGLAAFGKAVGGRAAGGQPQQQAPEPPPQPRRIDYQCSACNQLTTTDRTDKFMCSNPDCAQVVYIDARLAQAEMGEAQGE